jgi:anti-sigma factor RsiW
MKAVPTDLEIMMYHDGELSPGEADAVARFLESNADGKAKADCLGQMSGFVQGSLELASDEAGPKLDNLWGAIENSIESGKESHIQVVPGGAGAAAEERATQALVAKAGWFGGWQSNLITGAVVAVAVAVLMIAVRPDAPSQNGSVATVPNTNSNNVSSNVPEDPKMVPVVLQSQEPEVEKLEVYGGDGVIMTVPGDEGSNPSTVIWISSDTDRVEDPI